MVSFTAERISSEDRELQHRVSSYLCGRNVPALRQIAVRAEQGTVTLSGEVTSFYHKQLCLHGCNSLPGVARVVDEVEVVGVM